MDAEHALVERLSERQRDVLRLVARGLTNTEIAPVLGVSVETVRTHLRQVFRRLEVTNRTEAAVAWRAWEADTRAVDLLLARPAIAVLPIRPLQPDPEAVTMAEGLTRDMVDLFSRWCWFPVIALASTRGARTLGPTCAAVSQALGARFLVDGSLRGSADQWRLVISVVDDGQVIWSDTRDFPRPALFETQDAVCRAVVAAAYPQIVNTAYATLAGAPQVADPDSWLLAHRAFMAHQRRDHEGNQRAREGFEAAAARDPSLVLAHFGQGLVAFDALQGQWTAAADASARLQAAAERCLTLAPHMAPGYFLHGRYLQTQGDHAGAARVLEQAIARNPSFATGHSVLGQALLLSGVPEAGLTRVRHAGRLNPRAFVAGLAVALFVCERYEEALQAAEEALVTHPHYPLPRALAAGAAWWLQATDSARGHMAALRREHPDFDPGRFRRTFGPDCAGVNRLSQALERLGLPRAERLRTPPPGVKG